MEKEDIISVQRAQEDVETSYNLLNNNNIRLLTGLVFVMQTQCVFSTMRTEFLNITDMSFTLKFFMFPVNLFVVLSLFRKHKFMFALLLHVPSLRIKISYNIIKYFYDPLNIISRSQ